jgi:uroporphyrinogen-III synthase
MPRFRLLPFSFTLGLAMTTAAYAAGEAGVCLVETQNLSADHLRDTVAAAGAEFDVIQVSVRYDDDVAPVIDRLVAGGCHLIVVTSEEATRAILVLSAADGPMPQTRTTLSVVGQLAPDDIVVFVHRLDLNSDPELLELITIEMRELMTANGLTGDDIHFERCAPECRGEPLL